MRHAEDQVIVAHRQKFLLAVAQPLLPGIGLALRTVPVPTRNGALPIMRRIFSLAGAADHTLDRLLAWGAR